jgi:hypothetical protein
VQTNASQEKLQKMSGQYGPAALPLPDNQLVRKLLGKNVNKRLCEPNNNSCKNHP